MGRMEVCGRELTEAVKLLFFLSAIDWAAK